MTSALSRLYTALRGLPRKARLHPKTAVLMLLVVTAFAFITMRDGAEESVNETRTPKQVTVATVGALSRDTEPLVLLGEVRSVSQAELRSQKPGEVTHVYARAGQYVPAGAILAEIDAAAERAAVLSAQGTLAAAEAQLEKTLAGARSEDRVSAAAGTQSATISLAAAQESARTTYNQAYALAADAVFAQVDDYFSKPYTTNPSFRVRTADYNERQAIEQERLAIGEILTTWRGKTSETLPADALDRELAQAQEHLTRISSLLNTVSAFVSEQEVGEDLSASDKAAQEAQLAGARASVDGARSSLAGARTALAGAESAQINASFGESKIAVGARSEDVAAAEAAVTQARGAVASAAAALENALIRTPIAGTVTTLNVSAGDFVGAQTSIAVVANPGALELEAFVTGNALERITVGQQALIAGTLEGTVTSAAPGLDPQTKKARITVSVPEEANLVNGSFVEIALLEEDEVPVSEDTGRYTIPITAVKVLPRGLAVFTVNDNDLIEVQNISEGPILGAKMEVSEGLSADLVIVTDVRGVKEGDTVEIVR